MSKQVTIHDLESMEPKDFSAVLRELAEDPVAEQEAVLMDIVDYAKDTEFGRRHNFAEIKSVEEFRKRVPVSEYAAYDSYIDRISEGEKDILFPGSVFEFGGTTGTTGKAKLIPESETGDLVKRIVVKMRVAESSRMFPAQGVPGNKKLTITNSSAIAAGNQTITSASGQAVARSDAAARARLVVPVELLQIPGIESPDMDYLTMLFGVAERNVVTMICNNMVHFYNMYKRLNSEAEKFFSDIENGTLTANISQSDKETLLVRWQADPERAAELRSIYEEKGSLEVADIWPNFGLASCWLSSSVGRYAKEYAHLFPSDTLFIHWGYGATEGKFDIPVEPFSPKGIPALYGYFFEFLELGADDPVTISETEPGKFYELIVTSYSGFYRYSIHDIVKVDKGDDGFYRLEFVCKSYDSIKLNGKMLYASEMTAYIEEYEAEHKVFFRYFHGDEEDGKLVLSVEPIDTLDADDFQTFIGAKLAASGITLERVEISPEGTRERALVVEIEGKTVNQTKLLVFK